MDKKSDQYKKYEDYIKSKEFKELKVELVLIRGCKCEKCGKPKSDARLLQLHHKTYERLYNEEPGDLILLCAKCHMMEHGLIKGKNLKRDKSIFFGQPHQVKRKGKAKSKGKKPKTFAERYPMTKEEKGLQARYDKLKTNQK